MARVTRTSLVPFQSAGKGTLALGASSRGCVGTSVCPAMKLSCGTNRTQSGDLQSQPCLGSWGQTESGRLFPRRVVVPAVDRLQRLLFREETCPQFKS